MTKKGFVFVETIIITTVLTVALLMIYLTFNVSLSNEKRHLAYDDISYLYDAYFIENFLKSIEIKRYINKYFEEDPNTYIKQFSCSDSLLFKDLSSSEGINQKMTCEKIFNNYLSFNISRAYISRYNLSSIKECIVNSCSNQNILKNIENMSNSFTYYIRTITKEKNVTDINNTYRLIIEFKEEEKDYENIKTPVNNKCDRDYILEGNKCIRNITKYYYASINLVV